MELLARIFHQEPWDLQRVIHNDDRPRDRRRQRQVIDERGPYHLQ